MCGGFMKVTAIIAEYNPLHQGHAYQLREVRRRSGCDFLIVVMSGDYVQRGVPAILDKFTRAEMAVRCGADLVLQLPLAASCGSAERFAEGAVCLLNALDVVDELWFGSECGRIEPFLSCAELLAEEPPMFSTALQTNLKKGLSFPAAREAALGEMLSGWNTKDLLKEDPADSACATPAMDGTLSDLHALLSLPNNVLGLSYCIQLIKTGSRIRPRTLQRLGADYHDLNTQAVYPSASAIRSLLMKQYTEDFSDLTDHTALAQKNVTNSSDMLCHTAMTKRNTEGFSDHVHSAFTAIQKQKASAECTETYKVTATSSANSSGYDTGSVSPGIADLPVHKIVLKTCLAGLIPDHLLPLYEKALPAGGPVTMDDFSDMLRYQLLQETADSLTNYLDVSRDLANRILHHVHDWTTITELTQLLKTRDRTYTAVSRALLHILLRVRKDALSTLRRPSYARILAFRPCGPLLKAIKERSTLPLVTNPTVLGDAYGSELFASSLYEHVLSQKSGAPFRHEYRRKIVPADDFSFS